MRIAIIFCGLLCLLGCQKKTEPIVEPNPEPVESFYNLHSVPYTDIIKQGGVPNCTPLIETFDEEFFYSDPRVSPNSPYQFCFLRRRNSQPLSAGSDLLIYDFVSNKTRLLAKQVSYVADWSSKDWIIYTSGVDATQILKVKANGDSLSAFAITNNPIKPKWSPSGTKFAFYCKVCGVIKIADQNGIVTRSLSQGMSNWDWWSENELLYFDSLSPTTQALTIYNLLDDKKKVLRQDAYSSDNTWQLRNKSDSMIHFGASMVRYNPTDGLKVAVIKNREWSDRNRCPNFSNDKIISQRLISTRFLNETCKISVRSHITLMDAAGGNERKILIPAE